ncbi:hypothetical protein CYY_004022 [Polysphondylium violaceum]|uniref:EGF-like domain-containing protein n=1 Tax=Polysphondylium violaceum TaxID=133409 RepID=A0A8J4V5K6_9MYCE|nr:hypothetical protein CYY_004022 [Polysphondylium violaceum]
MQKYLFLLILLFFQINVYNGQTLMSYSVDPPQYLDGKGCYFQVYLNVTKFNIDVVYNGPDELTYQMSNIGDYTILYLQPILYSGYYLNINLYDDLGNLFPLQKPDDMCRDNTLPLVSTTPFHTIFLPRNVFYRKSYTVLMTFDVLNSGYDVSLSYGPAFFFMLSNRNTYAQQKLVFSELSLTYNDYSIPNNSLVIKASERNVDSYHEFGVDNIKNVTIDVPVLSDFVDYPDTDCYTFKISHPLGKQFIEARINDLIKAESYPVLGTPEMTTYLGFKNRYFPTGPTNYLVKIMNYGFKRALLHNFQYQRPGYSKIILNPTFGSTVNSVKNFITFWVEQLANYNSYTVGRRTVTNPYTLYPYGFSSGTIVAFNSSISVMLGPYSSSTQLPVMVNSMTFVNFPFIIDFGYPEINSIEFVPTRITNIVICRVNITDDLSGLERMKLSEYSDTPFIIDPSNLVSGTFKKGIYEKVIDLNFQKVIIEIGLTDKTERVSHFVINLYGLLDYSPLDISKISTFYFQFNNIDVSNVGVMNRVYLNFTNVDIHRRIPFKLISSLEIASKFSGSNVLKTPKEDLHYEFLFWNEKIQMYEAEFWIPARLFSGSLDYHLNINGDLVDTTILSNLVGENATLKVFSLSADEMPPMVTILQAFPSTVVPISDPIDIGWELEITDDINGLEYGELTIASDFDLVGYTFSFSPDDIINKNEHQDTYMFPIKILPNCRSQTYYIKSLYLRDKSGHVSNSSYLNDGNNPSIPSPFFMFYKDLSLYTITTDCPSITDNEGPTLLNFSTSTQTLDVTSSNTFTVYFETYDPSGISVRHNPIIYLDQNFDNAVSFKAMRIDGSSNDTFSVYNTEIKVPYLFGYPNGFGVSVYGMADSLMNIRGYSFGDLYNEKGYGSVISTTATFSEPIIEYLGCNNEVYGYNFGLDQSKIVVTISNSSTHSNTQTFKVFSSVYIEIDPTTTVPEGTLIFTVTNTETNKVSKPVGKNVLGSRGSTCKKPDPIDPSSSASSSSTISSSSSSKSSSSASSSSLSDQSSASQSTNQPDTPKTCPGKISQCNGKGQCKDGECLCFSPWFGADCTSQVIIVPEPSVNPNLPNTSIDFKDKDSASVYSGIVSIKELNEIKNDGSLLHNYPFDQWLFSDLSNQTTKLYKYQTNITHPIHQTKTSVIVYTQWFDKGTNITFAGGVVQMNPSSIKYNVEIGQYNFDSSFSSLDIVFAVSLNSSDPDSCSSQQQAKLINDDYVSIEINQFSFMGRFIKRALVDLKPTVISNTIKEETDSNTKVNAIVSVHIPYYRRSIILDPDFSVLLLSEKVDKNTENSICNPKKSASRLSGAKIAGIVIGSVAFVSIVVVSVVYHLYKKKKSQNFALKLKNMKQ